MRHSALQSPIEGAFIDAVAAQGDSPGQVVEGALPIRNVLLLEGVEFQ